MVLFVVGGTDGILNFPIFMLIPFWKREFLPVSAVAEICARLMAQKAQKSQFERFYLSNFLHPQYDRIAYIVLRNL